MGKYVKKPLEVDAVQFRCLIGNNGILLDGILVIPNWVKDAVTSGAVRKTPDDKFIVTTLEGEMIGLKYDYLIRGIKGELYPCAEDIFLATYDPVEERHYCQYQGDENQAAGPSEAFGMSFEGMASASE